MSNADRVTGNWFAVNRSIMRNPLFAGRSTWGWAWVAILAATDYTTAEVNLTEVYQDLRGELTRDQWRHMIGVFKREDMLEVHPAVNMGAGIGHRQTARVVNWARFQPKAGSEKTHEDHGANPRASTERNTDQHSETREAARSQSPSQHGANFNTEPAPEPAPEPARSQHGANTRPAQQNGHVSTEPTPSQPPSQHGANPRVLKEFKEFKERKEELGLPAFQESQDDKTQQLNLALTNPDSPESRAFLAAHGHSVDQRPTWNLKKQLLGILGGRDFDHDQIQDGLARWARDHSAETVKAAWSKAVKRYQARYPGDTLRPMFYMIDILNFKYRPHPNEPEETPALLPVDTPVIHIGHEYDGIKTVKGYHGRDMILADSEGHELLANMSEIRFPEGEYATGN